MQPMCRRLQLCRSIPCSNQNESVSPISPQTKPTTFRASQVNGKNLSSLVIATYSKTDRPNGTSARLIVTPEQRQARFDRGDQSRSLRAIESTDPNVCAAFERTFVSILPMKFALVITGILAGIAITLPDLVLLGFFLLVVPGLVLSCAPTVFVYLAATAVIRRLVPITASLSATVVAFGVAILLGWAVMQPFRSVAVSAYRLEELPDVVPFQTIELDGHVRIERTDQRAEPNCDYLTLAVLDSTRVKSVTTVTAGPGTSSERQPVAAYALLSAETDPVASIFPYEPGQIVEEYLPLMQSQRGGGFVTAKKAVEAEWAMRLAGHERLRQVDVIETEKADWLIRIENPSNRRSETLRRVTIFDCLGDVHFRKTYQQQAVPAGMLYFGYRANLSGGPASASFRVGHQILASGEKSLKPESALLQAIKFRVPVCDVNAVKMLRDQTIQALDDPTATNARLALARGYLGLFFFDTKPHDHGLIARILADQRVTEIETEIKNAFPKRKTPIAMRDAYVERILMDHTSESLRQWLAEGLASLPNGSFSDADATYLRVWDSPEVYRSAAPLIATLADIDPTSSLPILDEMLDAAITLPNWSDRRTMIDGIRTAMVRLGPEASSAVPRIKELFLRRPSPIMNNAGDADQWRFALARMGVAIGDLPVLPNQSPQLIERHVRQVAEGLQRYDQDNALELKQ